MGATLAHVPARHPKPEQGVSQPNTDLDIADRTQAPRQQGPPVIHLGLEPIQPWPTFVRGKFRLRGLCQRHEVVSMATPNRRSLSARLQPLEGVLANRLQHRESRLAV